MTSPLRRGLMFLSLLGLCAALGAAEAPGGIDAKAILAAVGRPVGLVHLPRCGDGALALALAEAAPTALVHGQDADGAAVRRARANADRAGLVCLRVGFDQADLTRLLTVARSSDLVVLGDLTRKELTPALAGEIARVLQPWYGIAVLGGPGIPDAELRTWAGAIGTLTTDPHLPGLVLAHAGPLAGADDWTHWWHGPDNNPASGDRAYTLPETVQWAGKSYFAGLSIDLVTGGRCFVLVNGDRRMSESASYLLDGTFIGQPLLQALSTGSGVRLWTRRMPEAAWEQGERGVMVAAGTRLLVADNETVLVLDQASGAELARVDAKCGQIRYLAVSGDRLVVLGGPRFPLGASGERFTNGNPKLFHVSGLALAAFALKDLAPAWRIDRADDDQAFDPCSPAIAAGRIVTTTVGGTVEARELSDGRVAWSTPGQVKRHQKAVPFEWDWICRRPVSGFSAAGLYLSDCIDLEALTALDLRDGGRRWQLPAGGAYNTGGGLLFLDDHIVFSGFRIAPADGSCQGSLGNLYRGGCARLTASPLGLFGPLGYCWDAATQKPAGGAIRAKASCDAGTIVADGLAWKFPASCSQCTEWRGFLVRGPREAASPPLPRLTTAGAPPPAPEGTTPLGWTTYRGDERRSGSVAATVPTDAAKAWTARVLRAHPAYPTWGRMIDPDLNAAPPVIAGKTIVIGDADGSLSALALDDGHRLWRSAVGGRIWSSPTIWRDRVLVGCIDGTLAEFALNDGHELWRLRVAPGSARMQIYGQLGSRWPVLGSPLVVGDRAFAVAGMLDSVDGVTMVCVDPAGGTLLWERSDWGPAGVGGLPTGAGQLCWDGTAVVFHGGDSPLVRVDPATGNCLQLYPDMNGLAWAARLMKAQDVGALADGTLVTGGHRLFTDLGETWMGSDTTYLLRDRAGLGRLPMLAQPVVRNQVMPSWDGQDVVSFEVGEHNNKVTIAALPDLHASLEATIDGPKADHQNDPVRPFAPPKRRWAHDAREIRGMALSANLAVVLESDEGEHWSVSAFSRVDGSEPWSFPLIAPPVNAGLAIAADGRVVVVLSNGSVVCICKAADVPPLPAVAAPDARDGLAGACFAEPPGRARLPAVGELDRRAPDATSAVAVVPTVGTAPANRGEDYCLRLRGYLAVPTSGKWTFWLTSDDGSRLLLHDEPVVDNDGLHGMSAATGSATLAVGLHPFGIDFFQAKGGCGLRLEWEGPGQPRQEVPAAAFRHRE
jgi:outer membrane protein assembly factor BamB